MNTESITGHRRQLALLSTMIETGKIPQAMLFSGAPGIGKAKAALHFLSALFCDAGDRPCGTCRTCQQIQNKTFPDLIELYPDEKGRIPLGNPDKREAGSIRWLIERLSCRPLAQHRGVIIDGADTISTEGQNALLKSIEEPQENTHIILIAANRSRVLPTVLSRCTVIAFNPLSFREVTGIIGPRCGDAALADAAAALSGGSLETAAMAMDGKLMDKVIDLCGHISAYLNGGTPMTGDPGAVTREIGGEKTMTLLLNIYRLVLMEAMGAGSTPPMLHGVRVHDAIKARKCIKILLALRKGLANNLNVKISLKGMLYALDRMEEEAKPEIASLLYY